MPAWTVLMDWAKQAGSERCPYGLVVCVNYGNGAMVLRCRLKAGHKERHRAGCAYPTNEGGYVHVRTEWWSDQEPVCKGEEGEV